MIPIVAACVAGLAAISTQVAAASPGGWRIVLEWSPEACHANRESKEPQCREEHYFVLGRLEPVTRGADGTCTDDALDPGLVEKAFLDIPNRRAIRNAWKKDGSCSGLPASEYVLQLSRATRRFEIPEDLRQVRGDDVVSSQPELAGKFVSINPGLSEHALAFDCTKKYLRSVVMCVDDKFDPMPCDGDVVRDCRSEVRIRGFPKRRVRSGQ